VSKYWRFLISRHRRHVSGHNKFLMAVAETWNGKESNAQLLSNCGG